MKKTVYLRLHHRRIAVMSVYGGTQATDGEITHIVSEVYG